MELNDWADTECKGAKWDEAKQEWAVTVQQKGETVVLRPKHLVFATGMSGVPSLPSYPGMDSFKGQQVHSSQFRTGVDWKGKKVKLIDQATADKVGKCWGLGPGTNKDPGPWEGELRNMWKPTQVPNL
jgi:cation diffusion facilitator CzcD-associated flavoprotein CzcO